MHECSLQHRPNPATLLPTGAAINILDYMQVSTVYAVAIGTPSWGEIGPLAIGLSVFGCATAGALPSLPCPLIPRNMLPLQTDPTCGYWSPLQTLPTVSYTCCALVGWTSWAIHGRRNEPCARPGTSCGLQHRLGHGGRLSPFLTAVQGLALRYVRCMQSTWPAV